MVKPPVLKARPKAFSDEKCWKWQDVQARPVCLAKAGTASELRGDKTEIAMMKNNESFNTELLKIMIVLLSLGVKCYLLFRIEEEGTLNVEIVRRKFLMGGREGIANPLFPSELFSRPVAHPVRGPRWIPDQIYSYFLYSRKLSDSLFGPFGDARMKGTARGGHGHLDRDVAIFYLDLIDKAEIDDVDTNLRVEDMLQCRQYEFF